MGQSWIESQKRKAEAHEAKVSFANSRASNLGVDTARNFMEAQGVQRATPRKAGTRAAMMCPFCACLIEAPVPGSFRISFEERTKACSTAISLLVGEIHGGTEGDNA
jgi:hypothetical protein